VIFTDFALGKVEATIVESTTNQGRCPFCRSSLVTIEWTAKHAEIYFDFVGLACPVCGRIIEHAGTPSEGQNPMDLIDRYLNSPF